jgi:protein-disulfide isomerase
MANPNRTVWNARNRKFAFTDISSHSTRVEAEKAAQAARESGEWTRVKVQAYKWTGYVYVKGVRATEATPPKAKGKR